MRTDRVACKDATWPPAPPPGCPEAAQIATAGGQRDDSRALFSNPARPSAFRAALVADLTGTL